ncbi:LysE family translocator [Raoultella ornithinolytica]|uniref:LysE family translocator n=1 Tax=Raoultella ornithinolytica TaxID=54291 RepID=UPI001264F981|nr:LysE family translocator [Raoultella ornithinolytica]KAB8150057.1 LysE family translocator [Raoultella ornithinolytica]HCT2145278.1 LysE family translocator [Raoultella ornithinolytica]
MSFISPEFLLTSLLVVLAPGTGTLYTIATGLAAGRRRSFAAAFGCTLGIIPHLLAAVTGLAALLHRTPELFGAIKNLGVAWLLYMAWNTLAQRGALTPESRDKADSPLKIIAHAVMINLLNPKLPLFFFAFLPQFIRSDAASPGEAMLTLSGIFMLMTLLVFMLYGACAAAMRGYVLTRPRVLLGLRVAFAAGFVGLGIKLVLAPE